MAVGLQKEANFTAHRIMAQVLAECFRSTANPINSHEPQVDWEDLVIGAWEHLSGAATLQGQGQDPRNIHIESLRSSLGLDLAQWQSLHDEVFGLLISKDCPPYETEYLPLRDTTYISQQMADISGFYRAFGLEPDKDHPERVDYLCLELDFVGHLLTRMIVTSQSRDAESVQHFEVAESALQSFIEDHLGKWVSLFVRALERRIDILQASVARDVQVNLLHYRQLGHLLNQWLETLYLDFGFKPTPIDKDSEWIEEPMEVMEPSGCEGCMT